MLKKLTIPKGWKNGAVGDLARGIRGVTFSSEDILSSDEPSAVVLLRSNNIKDSRINFDEIYLLPSAEVSENQIARSGDVAVCMSNGSKRLVGKAARLTAAELKRRVSVGAFCALFRPTSGADINFVPYLFDTESYRRELDITLAGSAINNLKNSDIEGIKIPLPPLAEQRKIAEILRTWDEAIETAEAELKAKQERKRWLMQAVLSGSLRLKGCNKAWENKRLDQVGKIVPGGTPSTSIPEYWNGDVPWITPTEITKLKTPYIYNTEALITSKGVRNSSAALLPADSLIVCTRATVGVCAINKVPMTTNQGFKSVVPEGTDDTLFLYYVLNSMQSTFNRLAQGSTFLEISKTQFEKITIIWPSADERRLIASLMRTCDEQIESIGEAIEVLRAQKRGLMQKLLTGEVRVAA
jgi:type I restriction enzyme S subunit